MFVFTHICDCSILHGDNPIRHRRNRLVVCNNNDSNALFAAGILQQLQHCLTCIVIQRAGWFIAQQKLWIFGKGTGDRHTLLFPAGKLRREVRCSVCKPHVCKHLPCIQRIAADLGCQLHIFQRCQVSDQIIKLEHKANIISAVVCQLLLSVRGNFFSIQQDLSLRQRIHSAKDIQDRCLASAAGSDDHAEFAFFDFEIDALQCRDLHLAHVINFFHVMKFHKAHTFHSFLRTPFAHVEFVSSAHRHKSRD